MARLSLPTFRTTKNRQLIDQGSAMIPEETVLREPCDFMPQSPAPAMFASATQQSQKRLDIRALRLLNLSPQNHDDDSEDVDAEETKCHAYPGQTDINKMPATPPLTPSTSTTDTSFSSEPYVLSLAYNIRMLLRTRSTLGPVWPIMLLLALVVTAAIVLVMSGPTLAAGVLMNCFEKLCSTVTSISDGLEMGIEGFGWVCGRAVGRFGRGFGTGYRL